ncbi:Hsp70 family protein [Trujillonella endophytica]|uniref:Hypothetical chaperone protein n=1 Tax=Trujillonella endophytica TaxID=673521 RepID=A0A1H8VUK7_9ACTN|nr:Hsp70 family protein [Trujillella endophytica]SEP19122.1 hypothetical chaperone protein [Trujillella endophytica]
MSQAVAYGVDFGTSNSSIAVAYADGTTKVVAAEKSGAPELRSLVYLHRDGNRLTGQASAQAFVAMATAQTSCGTCTLVDRGRSGTFTQCRQHRRGGSCRDSRLLAQIKRDLSSEHLDRTNSWTRDYRFTDLVAVILKRLKRSADQLTGQDVRTVAIGRPVRFPGVESDPVRLQSLAEDRLHQAAVSAGFRHVDLVPEPQAAVTVEGVQDGIVVCTDFGGGTFDVAVLSKRRNHGKVLALGGVTVGGETFDSRIFDLELFAALGLDAVPTMSGPERVRLPGWFRSKLRSLAGCQELLMDDRVGPLLRDLSASGNSRVADALRELLYGGQAWACFQAIERAKIQLSSQYEARLVLRRPPHLDIDVVVERSEFEDAIAAELARVEACILETLEKAGVTPTEVSYVTRTGGSSRIPAFEAMLGFRFGAGNVVDRDAFTTVVTGLAQYAHGSWQERRGA